MSDISELENKKKVYENMSKSIENAINKLKNAENYMKQAENGLKDSYDGNLSETKSTIVTNNITTIGEIRTYLEGDIKSAINAKIREIQRLIDRKISQMEEGTTET